MLYIDVVTDTLILITLLVKLGVAAAVASALARSRTFQRLLFAEHRSKGQTAALLAFFLVPLTLGVWVRTKVPNFLAADISFETVILLGLLLGPGWAMLGGVVLSVPAVLHHEYLTPLFNAALGLAAGLLGKFVEMEEIWSFTPFIDLSLWRWVRRNLRKPRIDRQIMMLFLIVVLEICREWLAQLYPHRLFALDTTISGLQVLVWLCAVMVVGIAGSVGPTVGIGDIADHRFELRIIAGGAQPVLGDVEAEHGPALAQQALRRRLADARRGPGDRNRSAHVPLAAIRPQTLPPIRARMERGVVIRLICPHPLSFLLERG